MNDNALVSLEGVAAALMAPDINTDIIAPLVRGGPGGAQPAGIRSQEELAQRLFGPWRYLEDGRENPEFILNREPWRQARFLVAGPNFACGSSRETAATMLKAFGVRCVVAPGFGQIFHDNCYRNHMLPLALEPAQVEALGEAALAGRRFALDVQAGTLSVEGGPVLRFEIPQFRRQMLLEGADEVQVTLGREADIAAWQQQARQARAWEFLVSRR